MGAGYEDAGLLAIGMKAAQLLALSKTGAASSAVEPAPV